jgi:hypothetical protein
LIVENFLLFISKYWRNNLVELGPSLSGFLDNFASFPRLVCQTNVINPLLRKGKIPGITPGIEPSTFGVAVDNANHYTIQAAFYPCSKISIMQFQTDVYGIE